MTDLSRNALLAVIHACGPVRPSAIADGACAPQEQVDEALVNLEAWLDGTGLRLERRRDGVVLVTREDFAPLIRAVANRRPPRRLAPTTKLILFALMRRRRPTTKAQLAALRGEGKGGHPVDIDSALQTLRREGLIARVGWEDGPGRAAVYAATGKAHAQFPDVDRELTLILGRATAIDTPAVHSASSTQEDT